MRRPWTGFVFTERRPSPATKRSASLISQRASVEMLHRHFFQFDAFETADVDRRRLISLGIDAFSIGMDSTGRAKAVLDDVLVEGVRAEVVFRGEQAKLLARHEPQKRSLA